MALETILYVSDQATSNDSVAMALEAGGLNVVSTSSSTQAIALLFVVQSVAAVVLRQRLETQTSCELARKLRAICPEVPIIFLGCEQVYDLPSDVDAFVSAREPLEKLTSAVRRLLSLYQPFATVLSPNHCGKRRI
jgi:DNA-binding NarL/FixJ family response regulator